LAINNNFVNAPFAKLPMFKPNNVALTWATEGENIMFKKFYWFSFLTMMALFLSMTAADLDRQNSAPSAMEQMTGSAESADPLWCPSGVAPTPAANGCTKSYPDLYSLINDIATAIIPQPNTDGTIWIAMGADNSPSNIVIDGNQLGTWSATHLTLQGGWDGISGSTATPGTSSFTKYIHVLNWNNSVAINDLSVSGTSDTGLKVDTLAEIRLQDISSSMNVGYGAYLNNIKAGNHLNIAVTGTNSFDKNGMEGLAIYSLGAVTLNNITASNNGSNGVGVMTGLSGLKFPVTVSGKNIFNNNGYSGMYIEADSDIFASGLSAAGNGTNGWGTGVVLDTLKSKTGAGITVTGPNDFTSNVDLGLIVNSLGPISIDGVYAGSNGQEGVSASNFQAGNTSGAGVTLSNSQFSENGTYGLYMLSNGPMVVKDVKAAGNGDIGLSLSNPNQFGQPMDVSVTTAESSGNGKDGLSVYSYGLISVDNASGTNNKGSGADLNNTASANISDIQVSNSYFGDNQDQGLRAFSFGNITVDSLKASKNGSFVPGQGAYLDNCRMSGSKCRGIGYIKLGNSTFSSNTDNGLLAISNSDITISDTLAELNGHNGFSLQNYSNMDVYCSQLNNNQAYGIEASLPGSLSLYGVTFSGNVIGDTNILGGGSVQPKAYQCGSPVK
jgi:parallel beta helix pectate lyase-like protein